MNFIVGGLNMILEAGNGGGMACIHGARLLILKQTKMDGNDFNHDLYWDCSKPSEGLCKPCSTSPNMSPNNPLLILGRLKTFLGLMVL